MHHAITSRRLHAPLALLLATLTVQAQWDIQDAHTTASLRGIDNVGDGIAWASGTGGTILRTEDGGYVWQLCAVPPGAEKLDFRGIQAFDANTAIAMSSGPGDQSRLYKTTDGCQTWKLIFTNPDKQGFWDAVQIGMSDEILILGDPVNRHFALFSSYDAGKTWSHGWTERSVTAAENQSIFAASNSSVIQGGQGTYTFVTGGSKTEAIEEAHAFDSKQGHISKWFRTTLPLSAGKSSGAFSIASNQLVLVPDKNSKNHYLPNPAFVVVGGDYLKPDATAGTAAYSRDYAGTFNPAQTPPHGYRSAVAYDAQQKLWITVGPNGTDISTDDGRNWRALKPSPTDPPDADKNWNALSLPYVVGPKGRIGKLRPIHLDTRKP